MDAGMTRELEAMQELGRRRSQVRTIAFVVGYVLAFALLFGLRFGGVRIGVLWIGVLAAPIAAAIAGGVLRSRTAVLIAAVAREYEVPAEALSADKYLVS